MLNGKSRGHNQMSKKRTLATTEVYDENLDESEINHLNQDDIDTEPHKRKRNKRPPRDSKYKGMGKRITVPIIKLSAGDTWALQFTGEVREQKIGADNKPPATLYRVVDMDTGEVSDLIGSKVLVSTIEKNYPDDKIVGKKLLLECDQRPDKKYLDVLISELE